MLSALLLFLLTFWQVLFPYGQELAGKVPNCRGQTVYYWLRELQGGNLEGKKTALDVLKEMGPNAKVAIPTLLRLLREKRFETLDLLLGAVHAVCRDRQRWLPELQNLLEHPEPQIRARTLEAMKSFDPELLRQFVPYFLQRLALAPDKESILCGQLLGTVQYDLEKDRALLQSMLGSPSVSQRLAALEALARLPRQREMVPSLTPLVQDSQESVRLRALIMLCRYAGEGKADPHILLQALGQEHPGLVRNVALDELVRCGAKARPLLPALTTAMTKAQGEDKVKLVTVLIRLGQTSAWDVLLRLCQDGDATLRHEAVYALGDLAKDQERARRHLRELSRSPNFAPEDVKMVLTFRHMGTQELVWLEELSQHPNREVRRMAIQGLRVVLAQRQARQLLIQFCRRETDAALQLEAATYLARRTNHPAALPYLGENLANRSLEVKLRREAALLLQHYAVDSPDAASYLVVNLEAPEAPLRTAAAQALHGTTLRHPLLWQKLHDSLLDSMPTVRAAAAETLGALGSLAHPSLPDLYRLLDDPDDGVQAAALTAVTNLDPRLSLKVVRLFLKHPAAEVRRAAVRALAKCGSDARQVVPELVTLAQDEDWHLQNQVLRYLGELHPEDPAVFACLLNALEDPKESSAESRVTARTAYEALLHWEKFPPPVRAQLQHYLLVNWSVLRLRAASILLKTERSPFALAVLCNGLSDTDSYHRTETLRCLRLHGPEARRAVPQLLTLVQQPLDELNPLAAAALWNIDQHPEALAAFTRILRAPEAGRLKIEVCAILLELRGAGLRRLLPELRQCLGRGEDHEPWERYWYKQTIAHLEAMEHQGK